MPFKSKAQQKWMFAAEKRGEVKKGTAERWAEHTPDIKKLPEKRSRSKFDRVVTNSSKKNKRGKK